MGVDQPFLYDPPSRNGYGDCQFNPKAVSQASLQPPKPLPKQEGPLVEFNRHPDSYLILPYGNVDAKPMSPRTRKTVKYCRQFQLMLRCMELLGAVGLMVCVICVRHVDDALGWTLRIPPVIAMIHCIYAMYHLCRSPTGRTPISTAGYMLFASGLDAIFLPFYVFIALTSNTQWTRPTGKMVWKSVFDDPIADRKVVRAVFFFGVLNGGFHLISLLVSLFLALVFRKIARLPPDMNPLEDNLTSRHKRTKSEITEKRTSHASATTSTSGPGHGKHHSHSLHEPLIAEPPRSVPFMQTRRDSTESFGGQHRYSSPGARNSRADLPSQLRHLETHSRVDLSRSSGAGSASKRSSYYAESSTPPKHNSRSSLINDNWYTYFHHEEQAVNENLARSNTIIGSVKDDDDNEVHLTVHEIHHDHSDGDLADYGSRYSYEEHEHDELDFYHHDSERDFYYHHHPSQHEQQQQHHHSPFHGTTMPNPLESNPPTPPPGAAHQVRRIALQDGSPSRANGSFKAKLYGDLKAKTPPVMMMGTYVDIPLTKTGERAVSNSGADYEYVGVASSRTREVSGKVAEEGRGDGSWSTRFRKISGRL